MKIVVLDGYTLNPGDLDWNELEKLGDLKVYERTGKSEIADRCRDAAVVFTNKTPLDKEVLSKLPSLRYIGVLATGYNIVDVAYARELNIVVTNVPAYSTDSVAQMTFALLLELCLHVQKHGDAVKEGRWSSSADFCFWDFPLMELAGKTMGIIGFGNIGKKVAGIAEAFGMKILSSGRTKTDQSHRANFQWVEIDELMERSDVVSLHCPLTEATNGLINLSLLQKMKPSAFLLNTSRGPLIVEKDLADALAQGTLAGAGLDVLSVEPPGKENPLLCAPNCLITPHISWATQEARGRLMERAVKNLAAFLEGKTIHKVN